MTTNHPIAIIGGGLGGLTLALILKRNGIDSTVFELDASPSARRQGGMLDMHEESGQFALREAGVFDEFRQAILAGGQTTLVRDKTAELLFESIDNDPEHAGRPEVDRGDLRRILLSALPDDAVRWGSKVTAVRSLGGGRHEVDLADGGTFTTDLLVGADGAWSKVRALLSAEKPHYLGVTFVEMHLNNVSADHPVSLEVAGNGSLFALDDEKGLLTHRGTHDTLHIGAAMKLPADWSSSAGLDVGDRSAVKATVEVEFADWDARLRGLIADSDGPFDPYPLVALSSGHSWQHQSGVTLLGDAAHVMSPFAGEGANLAMLDAAELAAAIVSNPEAPDAAIAAYERTMIPRAEEAATESAATLELCFAPNAAKTLSDMMSGFGFGRGPQPE
jgi:2-polyprenyl-6-methoxyphenol hydroxylase-like FAD-dependent oxidoreductase